MRGSVGARRQRIPPDIYSRYHPTPGAPGRTGAPAQPCAGIKLKTELEPGRYCVVEGLTLFTARPRLSAPPTARCRDFPRVSLTDGSAWAQGPTHVTTSASATDAPTTDSCSVPTGPPFRHLKAAFAGPPRTMTERMPLRTPGSATRPHQRRSTPKDPDRGDGWS